MQSIDDAVNKQNFETDKELTRAFTRLLKNNDISAKAVVNNGGKLKINIGEANGLKEYFQRYANFDTTSIPSLTEDQITKNKAFQLYREQLHKQGYDVHIKSAWGDTNGARVYRFMDKTGKAIAAASLFSFTPPIIAGGAAIGCVLSFATSKTMAYYETAGITLNISKIETSEANQNVVLEQQGEELLAELNQAPQKEKQPQLIK